MLVVLAIFGFNTISPPDSGSSQSTPAGFSHALLESVLNAHVDSCGRVDYTALSAHPWDLKGYYRLFSTFSPESHPQLFPTAADSLAYWINAYNGAVLRAVVEHYPISSVGEVLPLRLLFFMPNHSGFFYFQKLRFGGRSLNLNEVEHEVIREGFDDPRIHFAINCASNGCPRLPQHAFSAANLDAELNRETRRFIAEKRNLSIDDDERIVHLSSIFSWYEADYVNWYRERYGVEEATLMDYIRLYASPELQARLEAAAEYEIRSIPYDWGLNDQSLFD